jgi:hypothetical protein
MQWTWTDEANVNDLTEKLIIFAEHQGYKTQRIGRNRDILEMGKTGIFRQLTGLSAGLRLVITAKQSKTVVDVSGHGKEFAIKAVVGLVGIFLFFLPTASAAYGAYAQNKLMDDVKKEINDYFDSL